MKKSLSRAIAITAASAAGMAGALVATPAAIADQPSAPAERSSATKLERTGFGYKADVFGTKVLVDGVELRGLKDGYAQQRCTALAGRSVEKYSALSIPEEIVPEGLIDFGVTKQTSDTYREGKRTGVRGVSTIGSLRIGGAVEGLGELPLIELQGLTSVADAFHTPQGYDTEQSFGFEGLTIELLKDNPVTETLKVLLETLGLEETVKTIPLDDVNDLVDTLVKTVAQGLGNTIEIPGLGEIGIGYTKGKASAKRASSEAYALKISLLEDVAGQPTSLQLGRARTYIGKAGKAGVFRGTATGANLLGDAPLVNLGNLGQRSIPCDGTNGKVVTKKAGSFRLAGGLVGVDGVTYQYMGDHLRRGAAKALIGTTLGTVTVPSLELEIKGLSSLVKLRRPAGSTKVKRSVSTDYLQILHKGQPVSLRPGQSLDLGDGNVLLYKNLFDSNRYGIGVDGLALKLANIGILDLATSAGRIFAR